MVLVIWAAGIDQCCGSHGRAVSVLPVERISSVVRFRVVSLADSVTIGWF
jgi:hypothetical protein